MTIKQAVERAIAQPTEYAKGEIWAKCGDGAIGPETPAILTQNPIPEGGLSSLWHLFGPVDLIAIEGIGWH